MTTAAALNGAPAPPDARPEARLFACIQMRAKGRLFQTGERTPCADDPELFFDPRRRYRAAAVCADCPFRGRCGYNAVATGATHGVWGGIILPGDYPRQLAPVYARLREQFNQRRNQELGDAPVPPLPDIDDIAPEPDHAGAA